MDGPDHYRAAEESLFAAKNGEWRGRSLENDEVSRMLAGAQVHAILALVASNLALGGLPDDGEWTRVLNGDAR
jgi:hypothetical protein